MTRLAYAASIEISQSEPTDTSGMVVDVTHDAKVYMPLAELVDIEKEKARLQKDLGKKQGELKGLEGKLSNPGFLAKAPEAVVAGEKDRAEKLRALIAKLEEQLAAMGKTQKRGEGMRRAAFPPFRLKYHVQTADRPLGDRQFSGERSHARISGHGLQTIPGGYPL